MIFSARARAARSGEKASVHSPAASGLQRGVVVIFMSLIMLILITTVTFYANKGAVIEQNLSVQHLHRQQAYEAAQGGLDYALAWMTAGNSTAWIADVSYPPYDQKDIASIAVQTMGDYLVTVTLWHKSSAPEIVEINSTSAGDASASVSQIVNVKEFFRQPSVAPLMVHGCISDITGQPFIDGADASGHSVVTSAEEDCVDMGHMGYTGTIAYEAFSGNAWDYTFGMPKTAVAALAGSQTGGAGGGPIYYYNDATVGSYSPSSLGSAASPVVLIFDITSGSCPKINGGVTVYGIVYCGRGFDMQGWGGTTIQGALITDTALTKFTAGTILMADPATNDTSSYHFPSLVAKVAGSWRDF